MNVIEKSGRIVRHLGKAIGAKSPVILTGCAVAGVITTVVFAVVATPKAEKIIEDHKKRVKGVTSVEKRRVTVDTVLSVGRVYLPTFVSGATTIGCILGANSINTNRQIALATAYNLSTKEYSELKEKTKELVGENKAIDIEDKIREDHVKAASCRCDSNILDPIETGHGNTLCFDDLNGRFFRCSPEYIKTCLCHLYSNVLAEDWVSYDDFYFDLDLPTARASSCIGISSSHAKELIDFGGGGIFSSMLKEDTGEPVLVMKLPIYGTSVSPDPWSDRIW